MDLAARTRGDFLLRVLLALLSDPRTDRTEWHPAGERLPRSRPQHARRERLLVLADAAVAQRRRSCSRRTRLDRTPRFDRDHLQSLATGEHRRRRSLFPLLHRSSAGLLLLSVRRHAAGGRAAVDLLRAAWHWAGPRRRSAAIKSEPLHVAMGVVPHLFRVRPGENPQWRAAMAEPDGHGQVLRERPTAVVDGMARAAMATLVSRRQCRRDAHHRALRLLAGLLSEVVAADLFLHHHAAADRNHPHGQLRVPQLPRVVPGGLAA